MKSHRIKLEGDIIGFDIGQARTGVARMNTIAKIPEALQASEHIERDIEHILSVYNPCAVVVGLPRNLNGGETQQTILTRDRAESIRALIKDTPLFMVDEAGTTKEAELRATPQESIDSVAAGIILETFMDELTRGKIEGYEV